LRFCEEETKILLAISGHPGRIVTSLVRIDGKIFRGGSSVGVRETLNKKPSITTGATIGIILLALIFIIYQVSGSGGPHAPTKAFYTVDDGATWFLDDIKLIPPFDHDGKPAVKANVYKCGSKEFVGYLEEYIPDAKKQLESAKSAGGGNPELMAQLLVSGRALKAPGTGDKGWIRITSPAADRLTIVQCPDGSAEFPTPVLP
jgi:hypothetical protein